MQIENKAGARNIIIRFSRVALNILHYITFKMVDMRYDKRTTTVGRTVYLGANWYTKGKPWQEAEIAHEQEHVNQWIRWWILYPITYMMSIWSVALPIASIALSLPMYITVISFVSGSLLPGLSPRAYWEYRAFKKTRLTLYNNGLLFGESKISIECNAAQLARIISRGSYYYAGYGIEWYMKKRLIKWIEGIKETNDQR